MTNDRRTVASKDGTCISTDGTCIRRSANAHGGKAALRYIIKKNGKRYNSKTYDNYEQARSYIRKKLRSKTPNIAVGFDLSDTGWLSHNNPSINLYGFSITKV